MAYPSATGLLTPEAWAKLLPRRPLLTSPPGGWGGLELQMYRNGPGGVSARGSRDHVLVLNMAGRTLIDDTCEGRRQKIWSEPGSFCLEPAGKPASRSWKGSAEVVVVYLKPNLISTVAQDLDLDPTAVHVTPRLAVPDQLVHHFGLVLRSIAANAHPGTALMVDSVARALTVHLLRQHSNVQKMIPTRQPELPARRLTTVIDYMRAHFNQPVTVSELAEQCGLSSTHFTRAFREAVGKPPHAYLIDIRLDKARDLLEHTRLPITEIALSCGFEQSQYFATVFRQRIGFTPSSWRTQVAGTLRA